MKNIPTLLIQVEELNKEGLLQLKNRIDYILINKINKSNKNELNNKDKNAQILYEVITDKLCIKLKINKIPFSVFKKSVKYKEFIKKYKELSIFYNEIIKNSDIKNKKLLNIKLYNLSIEIVINWVIDCEIPLCLSTVVNNIDKIPGLINKQFPGYLENNLCHLIIK